MPEMALSQAPDNHIPNHGNSSAPERVPEIQAAWAKAIAEHGPPQFDNDPVTEEETVEAATEPDETTEPETPSAKGKEKAKAKEPAEKEAPAAEPTEEVVTVRNLIEHRRALSAKAAERDQQRHQIWQGEMAKVQAERAQFKPLLEAVDCLQRGDFEGLAKGLLHYSNDVIPEANKSAWEALQTIALQNKTNPALKETRELKRKMAERDALDQQRQQQAQQEQQARARAYEIEQHKLAVRAEIASDPDEAAAELAELNPRIVDAVFAIQQHHYDATGGEVLSPRKAVEKHLANVGAEFRFWADFAEKHPESPLIKNLTGRQKPAPNSEDSEGTRKAATSEKRIGKPPTKNVSHTRGASAAASGPKSSEQLLKEYTRKIQSEMDRNPSGNWGADVG